MLPLSLSHWSASAAPSSVRVAVRSSTSTSCSCDVAIGKVALNKQLKYVKNGDKKIKQTKNKTKKKQEETTAVKSPKSYCHLLRRVGVR